MSHAAQCLICKHQVNAGNMVIGCRAFEDEPLPSLASHALTSLIYRAALSAPCPVFTKLIFGPDAYRASDLPIED